MKTIKELFTNKSKWIKGTSWAKLNGDGCGPDQAECFCLSGAVALIYGVNRHQIDMKLDEVANKLFPDRCNSGYISFNDHQNTTFEDILKVVNEADV